MRKRFALAIVELRRARRGMARHRYGFLIRPHTPPSPEPRGSIPHFVGQPLDRLTRLIVAHHPFHEVQTMSLRP